MMELPRRYSTPSEGGPVRTHLVVRALGTNVLGPARGPWANLGRLPLRVFSIGKYAFQKKGASVLAGYSASEYSPCAHWIAVQTYQASALFSYKSVPA
jgi:hypothetical protein